MKMPLPRFLRHLLATACLIASCMLAAPAFAQAVSAPVDAAIRKALIDRLPNLPKIDEVSRSPVAGLYEVRYGGTEIMYADEKGDFVMTGALIETKTSTNLTEARVEKLRAIDFDNLPIKDAVVIRQGTGARKMAVFADPNCGYCKRFERDLTAIKDVTIYTFLIPILGPDSATKTRDIWCAKDAPLAWRAWMLDNVTPSKAASRCDSAAIERNLEFSKKHRINGTPAVFFVDGTRRPGAIPGVMVESLLVSSAAAVAGTGKKP